MQKAGLPISDLTTAFASLGVNLAVAVMLFFLLGGLRQTQLADTGGAGIPARPYGAAVAVPPQGPRVYGGSEGETFPAERLTRTNSSGSLMAINPDASHPATPGTPAAVPAQESATVQQLATVAGLAALAVLTLVYKLDIGFVAITIGLLLSIMAPNVQKRAVGQVAWPEIMLIVGVSTYVGVMEKNGNDRLCRTERRRSHFAADGGAAAVLVGAVVSAFASSTAVLGSLIPLAVPFLQQDTGVDPIGFIAAMGLSSTGAAGRGVAAVRRVVNNKSIHSDDT